MIFLLKNIVTGDKIFLLENKTYTIGRKNCDVLLETDDSVSRRHAIIQVKKDYATLKDCKSKYHTLRNGVQVSPEVEIKLEHMDSVQFGMLNSKFSFESYSFMTAASALSVDKKQALKQNIAKCNGKYVEKWTSNCTHLTVEKITLTVKVLQALIDEKPLVQPEYWLKYAQSIEKKTAFPDINNYNRPPVAEQLLRSDFEYKLDPKRKTLFRNKMFVFLKSNIKQQMEEVIRSCGGDCMAWETEGPKTFYEITTSPKEYLIIKNDSDDENISFNAIIKETVKQKKRAIPLNEIALAIVHCSCEVNCNPDFNKVSEVFGARTQKAQTMGILALETETENMAHEVKTENVIPASVDDDWTLNVPDLDAKENGRETAGPREAKRTRSADQKDAGNFKKPKIEEVDNRKKDKETATKTEDTVSILQKSIANNKIEDTYIQNKRQPSQKRKADDLPESNNLNPFSSITITKNKKNKIGEEENPFELRRGSGKPSSASTASPNKSENPFAHLYSLSKSTRHTTTVKEEIIKPRNEPRKVIKVIPTKSETSFISTIKKSLLNGSWMSKSTIKLKSESKEEDPILLEISIAFRNCVIIDVLPMYMYNKRENSKVDLNDTSVDGVDGKQNFKKFRKVKPMKPQATIIPRHQLIKVESGKGPGMEIGNVNGSDDENDSNNVSDLKQLAKQRVKKFVL